MQHATLNKTLDLLERTAYGRGMNREQVQVTLGQLLQRAKPSHAELEILLGMLSKTRYAVENGADEH
jgi:tRNA C32,U32 (ribose-2'-O)-methylase TrmJ